MKTLATVVLGITFLTLASFIITTREDCRIARVVLEHAETAHDPAAGKKLLDLLPSVFNGVSAENASLLVCRGNIENDYDTVHSKILVALAKKSALAGERYFAEGKFVESYSAFITAEESVFGLNRNTYGTLLEPVQNLFPRSSWYNIKHISHIKHKHAKNLPE
ncbi:MAG: hypothetical protein HYT94_01610, partial [Parcubacteria group bacterium]|nr:hypothetical protein [Parcubacteria group bacterium]